MSWREGMPEPGITAAGLDTSVATQRATATHGESLNFILGLFITFCDQNCSTFTEERLIYMVIIAAEYLHRSCYI